MPFPIIPGGSPASTSYQVSRSLRFRASANASLSRTPSSTGNQKTWTWSGWVKRGAISGTQQFVFNCSASQSYIEFQTSEIIQVGFYALNSSTGYVINTSAVFRDPSSWYHIVVQVDTTQATSANRVRVYVNGVQQTTTGTQPAQNDTGQINTTNAHRIASYDGTQLSFDGYLAEVNFIDGQAKLPTDFGAFDTNGVWQPKAYTGTYGTNGFYLPFTLNNTSTYAGSFNGSSKYLTTPTSSNLAFGTGDFTIEGWFNQTTLNNCGLVCQDYATGVDIRFNEGASNAFGFYINSSSFVYGTYTSAFTNQWHHFALVRSGSGSNNVKLYLDGVVLCQTTSTANLTSNQFRIGANLTGGTTPAGTYFSGSISNVRVVKGTAVYTAPFTPSSAALTAITNTQLLTLQNATIVDNSSNAFTLTNTGTVATATATPFVANITSDASGQNNGWTSNNINYTSSGTTYDSMIDSPTNYADGGNGRGNYCVLNPLESTGVTIINGNLGAYYAPVAYSSAKSTISMSSGKWYWETTVEQASLYMMSGVYSTAAALPAISGGNGYLSFSSSGWAYQTIGEIRNNNTPSSSGILSTTTNDIINVAVDIDAGKIWFGKNGTFFNSGNPATGANAAYTNLSGAMSPAISIYNTSSSVALSQNFGQQPFRGLYVSGSGSSYVGTGAPPSGFSALNTQNLPAPALTPSP